VFITDKNDTFHFSGGSTTGHFRLMGLAMRRDELGQPVPVEGVGPVVSNSFVVRAQEESHKPESAAGRPLGLFMRVSRGGGRTWGGRT
jgi:hypothetical protein